MNDHPYREPDPPACPLRHPTETPALPRQLVVALVAAGGAGVGPAAGRMSGWPDIVSSTLFASTLVLFVLSCVPWLVTGPHPGSDAEREPRPPLWKRIPWRWIFVDRRNEMRFGWEIAIFFASVLAIVGVVASIVIGVSSLVEKDHQELCVETCETLGSKTLQHVDADGISCRCRKDGVLYLVSPSTGERTKVTLP